MPGATAWLDTPLPHSSIEQLHRPMVVIVSGYTLIVDLTFRITTCRSLLAIAFRT